MSFAARWRRVRVPTIFAVVMMVSAACEAAPTIRAAEASPADSTATRARQDSIIRSRPGYVVDSILPVEEEITRFRKAAGNPPPGFAGGADSRTALVRAFVRSLERADTTALLGLVVSRAEFGYLIYATSPNARPPYRQSPELVWLQRTAATAKGANRLLARLAGRPVGYRGVNCPTPAKTEGENTVWSGCAVRLESHRGGTTSLRLFGPIVQRGGRFKFLSLSNGL